MSRDPSELPFLERLQVDGVFRAEVEARAVDDLRPQRSADLFDWFDRVHFAADELTHWERLPREMTQHDARDALRHLRELAPLMREIRDEMKSLYQERYELRQQLKERENADRIPTA